jgi:hypothetical protein
MAGAGLSGEGEIARRAAMKVLGDITRILLLGDWLGVSGDS